jgi:predicted DNA binding CopG/RHH family protein
MKRKTELPEFKDEEELAAWVETHDTSDYMDEFEEVDDDFEVVRTRFSTKPLDVRIRTEYLEAIEELAVRRGLPYQALVQRWLLEKLNQEAPDLMTK